MRRSVRYNQTKYTRSVYLSECKHVLSLAPTMRFCLASVASVLSQFWRSEKRIVGDRGRSGRNGRKEGRKGDAKIRTCSNLIVLTQANASNSSLTQSLTHSGRGVTQVTQLLLKLCSEV